MASGHDSVCHRARCFLAATEPSGAEQWCRRRGPSPTPRIWCLGWESSGGAGAGGTSTFPYPLGRPKVGFRAYRGAVPSTCCTALSSEQSPASPFLSLRVLGDPRHLGTSPRPYLPWLLLSAAASWSVWSAARCPHQRAGGRRAPSAPRGAAAGDPSVRGEQPRGAGVTPGSPWGGAARGLLSQPLLLAFPHAEHLG